MVANVASSASVSNSDDSLAMSSTLFIVSTDTCERTTSNSSSRSSDTSPLSGEMKSTLSARFGGFTPPMRLLGPASNDEMPSSQLTLPLRGNVSSDRPLSVRTTPDLEMGLDVSPAAGGFPGSPPGMMAVRYTRKDDDDDERRPTKRSHSWQLRSPTASHVQRRPHKKRCRCHAGCPSAATAVGSGVKCRWLRARDGKSSAPGTPSMRVESHQGHTPHVGGCDVHPVASNEGRTSTSILLGKKPTSVEMSCCERESVLPIDDNARHLLSASERTHAKFLHNGPSVTNNGLVDAYRSECDAFVRPASQEGGTRSPSTVELHGRGVTIGTIQIHMCQPRDMGGPLQVRARLIQTRRCSG